MGYKEQQIDNPDFLHLKYSGIWDVERTREYCEQIASKLQQTGLDKVLEDNRDLEILSDANVFYGHAVYVAKLLAPVCSRYAVIDDPENHDLNEFYETVCVNRGLKLRYFGNEEEAVSWLME